MANVVEETNIVVERDYSDIFSIKQTAMEKLGPKYFEGISLAGLNTGELGFVLEQIGNITEDSFNTSAILFNEAFPNKCCIPESIYSHAAIFQLDNTFSQCSRCTFIMLLQQSDILSYGTATSGTKSSFYLDKRTVISVEGIPFTLDYDIRIDAQKKQVNGSTYEYNYSAKYVIDSDNAISEINDPYLKIRKTGNGYLILQFVAHQVERIELTDTIISNTKINSPTLLFEFEGKLAGFDIFYKAPTDSSFTQLTKRIMFSLPIKTPFCYYRLKNENTLSISFSTKDGYFQPEFNSEIKIVLYTTLGSEGTFESYNGNKIEISTNPETYEYNELLTLSAKPMSDSVGGSDQLSLEGLQAITVENYSTATELSSEYDIQTFFYNFKYRYGNEILVIKRRDDITERLFSAFLLIKKDDYIYPTNTLNLDILQTDFDDNEDGNRYSLKPGHVFRYKENSMNTLELIPDVMAYDTDKMADIIDSNDFVFTNPFLISVTKSPNLVGLYQTIVNQSSILDYMYSNDESFTQFVTSKVTISRSLSKDAQYKLSLSLIPSASTDSYVTNMGTYENNNVRVIAGFIGKYGEETGYVELYPESIDDSDASMVTFSTNIITNDCITSDGLFPITNAVVVDSKLDYMYVPITDVVVNIYVLYNDGIGSDDNKFVDFFDDISTYIITNQYSTKNSPITFIQPLNMMRSTVLFSTVSQDDGEPNVNINLSLLPMIKADVIGDEGAFNTFIERVSSNYNYMESCLPRLRNNTNIDIKFYNTYGKSNNYYIGDNQELINKVNIEIKFDITMVDGTDEIELKSSLKTFIKAFIEKVNSEGTNDLFISNLIRQIEQNFSEVHHLKFRGINSYSTDYQTISTRESNLDNLSKDERRKYVPEILVVDTDNIYLSIMNKNS